MERVEDAERSGDVVFSLAALAAWGAARGLDSIQFTDYVEHGIRKSEVLLLPPALSLLNSNRALELIPPPAPARP